MRPKIPHQGLNGFQSTWRHPHVQPICFLLSDGTGITAETFGKAILNQFESKHRFIRLPFTDTVDKAHSAVRDINHAAQIEGQNPSCSPHWSTCRCYLCQRARQCHWCWTCLAPSSRPRARLGLNPTTVAGFQMLPKASLTTTALGPSTSRWPTMTDKATRDLESSDIILVGVSRSGKTTSLIWPCNTD